MESMAESCATGMVEGGVIVMQDECNDVNCRRRRASERKKLVLAIWAIWAGAGAVQAVPGPVVV
jgi:hypothetical protein